MWNLFKVNNKDINEVNDAVLMFFIVNFEQFSHVVQVFLSLMVYLETSRTPTMELFRDTNSGY